MNKFKIKMSKFVIVLLTVLTLSGCYEPPPDRSAQTESPSSATNLSRSPTVSLPPSSTLPPTQTPIQKPLEINGRKYLEGQIQANSNGLIKLLSFEKTNGIDLNLGGRKAYEMDYTAELEFLNDCWWNSITFKASERRPTPPGELVELREDYNMCYKGKRVKLNGKLMFEMTEKGWRAVQQ